MRTPCTVKFSTGVWRAGYDVVGLWACIVPPPTPISCLAEIPWRWPARCLPVDWDGLEIRAGFESSFTMRLVGFALSWERCGGTHHFQGDFSALDEV